MFSDIDADDEGPNSNRFSNSVVQGKQKGGGGVRSIRVHGDTERGEIGEGRVLWLDRVCVVSLSVYSKQCAVKRG